MDSSTLLLQATDSGSHDLITDIISNSKISASNLGILVVTNKSNVQISYLMRMVTDYFT